MNLKIMLFLVAVTMSVVAHSQKAKIKQSNTTYHYTVYPELEGFIDLKTYMVKVKDFNGETYSYSEGTTEASKKVDLYNPLGMAYGFNWRTAETDLIFDITLTSSEAKPREVQVHTDQSTQQKKYVYKFTAIQEYNVKIYSNQNDLIKEFTLSDIETISYWPAAPNGSAGYTSEKLLASNYSKNEVEVEGFIKKQKAALILPILKSKIGKEIVRILHESEEKFVYVISNVKTKDEMYSRLDSAEIYLNLGFDMVQANTKEGKKGNHHSPDAQNYFAKAHAIYKEYSQDKYINWFTDKSLQEEYIFAMATNLYLSSFLTSDFETANKLYEVTSSKALPDANAPTDNSLSSSFGSLKRSPAEKAKDNMDLLVYFLKREQRLYKVFQERMGY